MITDLYAIKLADGNWFTGFRSPVWQPSLRAEYIVGRDPRALRLFNREELNLARPDLKKLREEHEVYIVDVTLTKLPMPEVTVTKYSKKRRKPK